MEFIDNTPKGVTIHQIDEGIDTGDILLQKKIFFDMNKDTLASSYNKLIKEIEKLLINNFRDIAQNFIAPKKQVGKGTFHRSIDKKKYNYLLNNLKWKTLVKDLIMVREMKIANFDFNSNETFIVAELSANHNQEIDLAIKSIQAAKEIGVNAIKLQTYTPDTITIDSNKPDFLIKDTIWKGETLYDLYSKAFTPWEWHEKLFNVARDLGLIIFSSPFDKTSVDFLNNLNVPAYKIASFEIKDIGLIKYVSSFGKPVILSTGIAEKKDIDLAVKTIKEEGNNNIILLKCTSSYPAPINQANLRMIQKYKEDYNVITGLSDHTYGSLCPIIAVSLGAKFIEKHFILDKSLGGPDSSFSLDKKNLKKWFIRLEIQKNL